MADGLRNLEESPGPTEPGYEWRCNGCTFKTGSLEAAREHAVPAPGCMTRMLFERPPGYEDRTSQVATRRVFDHHGEVVVQRRRSPRGQQGTQ